jgi:hypothetical protein
VYADAGMAEDKIVLAEKEYDYAKKRSNSKETSIDFLIFFDSRGNS